MLIGETDWLQHTIQSSVCLHAVRIFQNYYSEVCRFSGRKSKPGIPEYYKRRNGQDFFFPEKFIPVLVPIHKRIQCAPSFVFPPSKLTTHINVVSRLGVSGFCLLHPLYALILCVGSSSLQPPNSYTDEQVTVAVRL
jgi:hypothetical protein